MYLLIRNKVVACTCKLCNTSCMLRDSHAIVIVVQNIVSVAAQSLVHGRNPCLTELQRNTYIWFLFPLIVRRLLSHWFTDYKY